MSKWSKNKDCLTYNLTIIFIIDPFLVWSVKWWQDDVSKLSQIIKETRKYTFRKTGIRTFWLSFLLDYFPHRLSDYQNSWRWIEFNSWQLVKYSKHLHFGFTVLQFLVTYWPTCAPILINNICFNLSISKLCFNNLHRSVAVSVVTTLL